MLVSPCSLRLFAQLFYLIIFYILQASATWISDATTNEFPHTSTHMHRTDSCQWYIFMIQIHLPPTEHLRFKVIFSLPVH